MKRGRSEAEEHATLQAERRALPIFSAKEALLNEIFARPVSLVLGETGSGKTTQLPQYLTEDPRCKGCVCVTQPRRVAAVTVATRIAHERGEEVGKKSVGYSVRFDEQCASDARIRVVTDGMLLREAMVDPTLSRYSVILLDEAHERSLATDLLLSLLKQLQVQRAEKRPLRLVVMSATLDPRLFLGFFGLDASAVLYIEGRQFPVHMFFTREPVDDVVDAALQTVLKIAHEKREGDVLVFLDGQEDIESLKHLLRAQISLQKLPLSVLPLYSALPQREQMKVFSPAKQPGIRRVILATNIAETSVTIPGIVFVVDSGLHKLRTFDPLRSLSRLQSVPVSRNSARQRSGRAGRERAGICYRLFTENDFFSQMEESERSEISRCSVSHVALTLLSLRVPNVLQFEFIERPTLAALTGALEELTILGAIDLLFRLTPVGATLAVFPLDPALAKVVMVAHEKKVVHDACAVAAMLVAGNTLLSPADKRQDAQAAREVFRSRLGDHLTYRNIFREFALLKHRKERKRWAKKHFVNYRGMENAENIYRQLLEYALQHLGPQTEPVRDGLDDEDQDAKLLKSLICGFFRNVALLNTAVTGKKKSYRTIGKGNFEEVAIHPSSVLCNASSPPLALLFTELVVTSKHYVRDVSAISQSWLSECLPHYYTVSHS